MRRFISGMLCMFLGISCNIGDDGSSSLKMIQTTPQRGVVGVLDQVPLLIEPGKAAVVTLNQRAGTPPADSVLRLQRLVLTLASADPAVPCNQRLTAATFQELVQKDIESPEDLQTGPVYRTQDVSMLIRAQANGSWILRTSGGHDIKDLALNFETDQPITCKVSAVGHGFYAVNGTGSWGIGSGDPDRDRLVRAWGGERGHRLWHYLWHGMRATWQEMDQADREALIAHFGPGVAPPDRDPQRSPNGEDFFYMHRSMLQALKRYLSSRGKEMIPTWKVLPRFGDRDYPSTDFAEPQQSFDRWEKDYQDLDKVRALTLGEYADQIERTIHDNMHARFMNPRDLDLPADPLDPEWERKYSKLYDDPANDYLGSTYASHANPVFYRLHGWVDDRIQTWLTAHGYKSIGTRAECRGQRDCYVWLSDRAYADNIDRQPWGGIMPSNSRHELDLHQHSIPAGPVPQLSVKARALLYKTRRMGGFERPASQP